MRRCFHNRSQFGHKRKNLLVEDLVSQRIGTDLELHDLAFSSFSAFDMPDEMRSVVGVERSPFPARIRIVDPPVHAARVKAERIRDA